MEYRDISKVIFVCVKSTSSCQPEFLAMISPFISVYWSILGDIRLWAGPRIEQLLSTWDLKISLPSALISRAMFACRSQAAAEEIGNNLKGSKDTNQKAKVKIRPQLSCTCHVFARKRLAHYHALLSNIRIVKSFCKSQFPHKCVNLSFTITYI